MKILILSYFNTVFGPEIFLKAPKSYVNENLEQIPSLMDLYESGFFFHMFGEFKSANFIFELPSKYARGECERLLISFLTTINNDINLNITRRLLKKFSSELSKIDNAYQAFYLDSDRHEGDRTRLEEIKNLFFNIFESIPEENIIIKGKDVKIFVFGLSLVGKTTIINCLQNSVSKETLPTTMVNISRIMSKDLSILTYDAPGQSKFWDLWTPYLKNQNGLVFVLDVADVKKFKLAQKLLHKIAMQPKMQNLPLLILFNKVDLVKPDVNSIVKEMKINELEDRPIKYFLTNALTNEGIEEAFNWLSLKLSERIVPSPEIDFGIILSYWDEIDGPKIVTVYPKDVFDDPELIIIRCFSLLQYAYHKEKFKKTSFILPFSNLNAKAAIYFDYISDKSIRGDLLPLSLVVFYNEKIPRGIIEKFDEFIFEKFPQIKEHFTDKTQTFKLLENIHKKIIDSLKSFKPTVKALRSAELRYQALFKAARDAILIIDRKTGFIMDANEQMEKLLLWSAEDIIGLHSSQIPFVEKYDEFMKKILQQIEIEKVPPFTIRLRNALGKSVPVEVNANEIQMGGQTLIHCIFRDITERERAEEALREAYDRANFYKNLFTHDINNILSNILSSVQLYLILDNNLEKFQKINEIMDIIREQGIMGAQLISNVRALTQLEEPTSLNLKKIKLNNVLNGAINYIYKNFQEKNIDIEVEAPRNNIFVQANEYLSGVIENLFINAVKFNENPTVDIFIRISNEQGEKNDKKYVKMEIIDNGIGISDDRKEIIFKKEYRKEINVKRVGIGLIFVKNVIDSYNGQIWVEDKVKGDYTKGSNFILKIPEAY